MMLLNEVELQRFRQTNGSWSPGEPEEGEMVRRAVPERSVGSWQRRAVEPSEGGREIRCCRRGALGGGFAGRGGKCDALNPNRNQSSLVLVSKRKSAREW